MERRAISTIFQQLTHIVKGERGIFEMGFDCLKVFQKALELDSTAMLTNIDWAGKSKWVVPEEKSKEYSKFETDDLLAHKEDFWTSEAKGLHIYGFQLPAFGVLIMKRKEPLNHLLLEDVKSIVHFIEDYFSAINDRNQKRELEDQLRKERNLMRAIIDSIPETIAFKDLNETYRVVNKMTDLEYRDRFPSIVGKTISEVYPESERSVVRALDNEVIESSSSVRKEVDMLTDRGFVRFDTIRTPVFDDKKNLLGIVSIGRDISETIKIKDNLARNNAFQDILVRVATNFINIQSENVDYMINEAIKQIGEFINADRAYVFEYDFKNHFITNTHEWCNTGVSPEIQNLQELPLDQFADDWVDIHKQGNEVYIPDIEDMDHESMTYQVLESQGIRSVISVPMMRDGECIGFVGFDDVKDEHFWNEYEKGLLKVLAEIITNLYTQKESEEQLLKAKDEAQKASIAKTEFLANMSHEIRTPLSGIYNAIYLLNTTKLNEEQHNYLEIGHASVEMLSSIVNNILDIAKIEANKMELKLAPFNLEDELFQIVQLEELVAMEKGIHLYFDFDNHIVQDVISDSTKIRQIVLNLVNNAIKFTKQGSVTLSVKRLSSNQSESRIRISIKDTGIGISPEHIQYLTDEFYQVDSSISKEFQGSGLGLSISSKLLGLFSSKLEITSILGEGSEFAFELTLSKSGSNSFKTSVMKRIQVLLVTENAKICPIRSMLESMNILVKETSTLPAEIESLPSHKYDLVLYSTCYGKVIPNMMSSLRHVLKTDGISMVYVRDATMDELKPVDTLGFDEVRLGNISRNALLNAINHHFDMRTNHQRQQKDTQAKKTGLSILVVDDNRINRKALEMLLQKYDYFVQTAENGIEAIEKAAMKKYDFIFMDIQMPGMNGIDATKIIRNTEGPNKHTSIFALTAHAFQSEYDTFMQAGMDDIITKPIDLDAMFDVMRKHQTSPDDIDSPDKSILIPDGLACFHKNEFINRFHDFHDLAKQILDTFMTETPDILQQLYEAVAASDFTTIHEKAHYLKGSCDYISAHRMSWITRAMIKSAQEKNESDLQLLQELCAYESELLRVTLSEYLNSLRVKAGDNQ